MVTNRDDSKLMSLLQRHFGYSRFRPGQKEVITAAMQGRDSLAVLPTGAGKSLCYQMASLMMQGLTLVISPLVALMIEQTNMLNQRGIRADTLSGGLSRQDIIEVSGRVRSGETRVLFLSPEALDRHLGSLLRWLAGLRIGLVAVDEAHCITDWGFQFRKDYRHLGAVRERVSAPVMALTATATPDCRQDVIEQLRMRDPLVHLESFARPNLRYSVLRPRDPFFALTAALRRFRHDGSTIIYSNAKSDVDDLVSKLERVGFPATAYHAGLPGDERAARQQAFRDGTSRLMVATVAFGMGVDHPDVRLVVHYRMPTSVERYYQESGRAGRDGHPADCLMLASPLDEKIQRRRVARMPNYSPEDKVLRSAASSRLKGIVGYRDSYECRQRVIVRYFGESDFASCGICDSCIQQQAGLPAEDPLFDALRRMRDRMADSKGQRPEAIFTDATLRRITRELPRSESELTRIRGVGTRKSYDFGPAVMRLVRQHIAAEEGREV